ncbi:MAG: SOS response-associated peptidase [Terriglobales bacterium]
MCGRFTLRSDGNALAQHFGLEAEAAAALPAPRFNIAPTQAIPVIRYNPASGRRELVLQRWGLIPAWAREGQPLLALFNARVETLGAKPAFRNAFRLRRCLIPADGFYEWKAVGKAKQPWFVHRPGHALFAFAGISEGESCSIITRPPTPALAALHNRMPAVPAPEDYGAWLDPARQRPEELLPLLEAPPEFELYPVSPLVNRAAADSPECVRRVQ